MNAPAPSRRPAPIAFGGRVLTDIVDSAQRAETMATVGGASCSIRLTRSSRELPPFRGVEVKTLGDGLMDNFDGAWMGIHCSLALISALRSRGVEIGAGLHTGEVEVGSEDVRGIAVHVAARGQHRLSRANAWSLER